MANVTNYITQNNIPMTASNYNEMDALVFSSLAYVKFENYNAGDYSSLNNVSLQKYAATILDSKSGVSYSDNEGKLLKAIAASDRYSNCTISNLESMLTSDTQWAGLTINMDNNTSAVAFRGTDSTTVGWTEDLQLAYKTTDAQKLSAEYLNQCKADHIYASGHSKGGNDAMTGYILSNDSTRSRVERVDNFDGPGVNPEFKEKYAVQYAELDKIATNYRPQDSIVGVLLDEETGNVVYIRSDGELMGQHDGYTWEVVDGKLVPTEQTALSYYLDQILDDSLSGMSPAQRKELIDLIEKLGIPALIAGKDTMYSDNIVDNVFSVLETIANAEPAERFAMYSLLASLISYACYHGLTSVLGDEEWIKICSELLNSWLTAIIAIEGTKIVILEKIHEFIEDIIDVIKDIVTGFCSFVSNVFNSIRENFDGSLTDSEIFINVISLYDTQNQIDSIMNQIDDYNSEINSICRNIGFWAGGSIRDVRRCINKNSDSINKCRKIKNVLGDCANYYNTTESKVIGYLA